MEVEGSMPTGVVLSMAGDANARRSRAQVLQLVESASHLPFCPHDADEVLHHFLQRILDLVRPFAMSPAFERVERSARGVVHLLEIDMAGLLILGVFRGEFARPFAKHEEIREGVSTEPVGAVDAGRTLASSEQPR